MGTGNISAPYRAEMAIAETARLSFSVLNILKKLFDEVEGAMPYTKSIVLYTRVMNSMHGV
jgi:hypothetical protein